jgi:6-phosphogluconolactonase (cycloisomerase 2 family)
MSSLLKLIGLACASVAAAAACAAPAHAGPVRSDHAVFVQNDDPAGNAIVAYERSGTGRLARAGSYPTGGRGGILTGSVVDHTASQGALAYDPRARMLFAVNAGSNTITTFAVDGDRLARRQVLPTGGAFPVSIAVHGSRVYVLNARKGASIQGYLRVGPSLVPVPGWHRDLGLDTSKTPEFANTPGQILFTPDGRHLVVTTKNAANSVEVFRVGSGRPSAPTITSLPGTVPFGAVFDSAGRLAVTEVGLNTVAAFTLNADDTLSRTASLATGQAATCWIVAVDGKLYLSNTGSGTVSVVALDADGALTALGLTSTGAAPVDAAASPDGHNLYVQTGATGGVDSFQIHSDGSLVPIGSVTVPNATGGEGIVAT